ncbi:hypothetical protein [Rhodobacteraceae bacterium W635]|uniref:hypothetical protein n=1 Tax=Nioella halotolerans TaxID=2303578 RepID=UPI0011C1632B
MFDNVTFRRSEASPQSFIDLGALAEALLFYQQANLLLDASNLSHLLKKIGPSTTQRLISSPSVRPLLVWETLGVKTDHGALPVHNFVQFQLTGSKEKGFINLKEGRVKNLFERSLGKSRATNKAAIEFSKIAKVQDISEGISDRSELPALARADLDNPDFVHQAIALSLAEKVPNTSLGDNWRFIPHRLNDGFFIETNLDFDRLNEEYRKVWPVEHSTLTPAFLLADLLEAHAGLHFASLYGSDVITTPLSSRIMQLKLQRVMESRVKNMTDIEIFQNATIGKGNAIREAINSGERSFEEFLDLLEHAAQFKGWLAEQEPDQSLVQDYYSEITAGTWAERLPGKSFRWVFFTGAGLLLDLAIPTGLGTATGVALSAGDAFLLEKLTKGWKPNQFVEGPLRQFTS